MATLTHIQMAPKLDNTEELKLTSESPKDSTMSQDSLTVVSPISKAIETRHSTRAFKPDPVPAHILEECLAAAQHSASNSNIQPWRVTVATGHALERLSAGLMAAINDPNMKNATLALPDAYKHYRSELGHLLYGKEGYNVPREAKEQLLAVRNRNYQFFGAPMGLIISMEENLADADVLSTGLYLQNLCLLLQEHGISSCIEVSVAGFPDVIRKELDISKDFRILCGVAVGYEDETQQVNRIKPVRDEWTTNVKFVSE